MVIETLAAPCWYLADPSGAEYNTGDGPPHLGTEEEARQYALGLAEMGIPARDLVPHQFARPCAVVVCDAHGTPMSDGVWASVHFDDETEAREWAEDSRTGALCPAGCGGSRQQPKI